MRAGEDWDPHLEIAQQQKECGEEYGSTRIGFATLPN